MKKIYLVLIFIYLLILISCDSSNNQKQSIIEKSKTNNVRVINYPSKSLFKNKDAYDKHNKGLDYIADYDYKQACNYFKKALELEPDNSIILNSLGLCKMRLYNYDEASTFFRKAIKSDSSYYVAYGNLGLNLFYDKKYKDAIEILKLANIDSVGSIEKKAIYFHFFLNYTKLKECDNAFKYYSLIKQIAKKEDKLFLENVEKFKKDVFDKDCQ